LLDERLCLAVQVLRLGRRWGGHGPQQRHDCDELLARSRGSVQIIDVVVGVDALTGLLAQLACAFSVRGSLSNDGGTKQSYRAVLLRELSLEHARLSQLRVDVSGPRQ
jgi:hypothetical protein